MGNEDTVVVPDIGRVRSMMRLADERVIFWNWVKCPLCLGFRVFEDEHDMAEYVVGGGVCDCGYRFSIKSETGEFPKGKLLVWDGVEVE